MRRLIKRLLVLLIIGGGSGAAYRALRRHRESAMNAGLSTTPEWPPFEPAAPFASASSTDQQLQPVRVPESAAVPPAAEAAPAAADWLPPVDGKCPPGYPIKANDNSRIYHVPGGRFYDRTIAEQCYATEAAAERDGYRQAKI